MFRGLYLDATVAAFWPYYVFGDPLFDQALKETYPEPISDDSEEHEKWNDALFIRYNELYFEKYGEHKDWSPKD